MPKAHSFLQGGVAARRVRLRRVVPCLEPASPPSPSSPSARPLRWPREASADAGSPPPEGKPTIKKEPPSQERVVKDVRIRQETLASSQQTRFHFRLLIIFQQKQVGERLLTKRQTSFSLFFLSSSSSSFLSLSLCSFIFSSQMAASLFSLSFSSSCCRFFSSN